MSAAMLLANRRPVGGVCAGCAEGSGERVQLGVRGSHSSSFVWAQLESHLRFSEFGGGSLLGPTSMSTRMALSAKVPLASTAVTGSASTLSFLSISIAMCADDCRSRGTGRVQMYALQWVAE